MTSINRRLIWLKARTHASCEAANRRPSLAQPGIAAMHTFKVVKEPFGWAVRMEGGMCTPFRSRAHAIREAEGLCEELRRHGAEAEVIVEGSDDDLPSPVQSLTAARLATLLRGLGQLRN